MVTLPLGKSLDIINKQRLKKNQLMKGTNPFPIIEEINLKVGISDIPITQNFRFISRVVFNIEWTATAYDWTLFGTDAALTNGIQIKYRDKEILPHGIRKNSDFGAVAYDTTIDQDNAATKNIVLQSRLSFFKFTHKAQGLRIDNDKRFSIIVQDNLSGSANNQIEAFVQGWKFLV